MIKPIIIHQVTNCCLACKNSKVNQTIQEYLASQNYGAALVEGKKRVGQYEPVTKSTHSTWALSRKRLLTRYIGTHTHSCTHGNKLVHTDTRWYTRLLTRSFGAYIIHSGTHAVLLDILRLVHSLQPPVLHMLLGYLRFCLAQTTKSRFGSLIRQRLSEQRLMFSKSD